jgi:hypothetical protein
MSDEKRKRKRKRKSKGWERADLEMQYADRSR